MMKNMDKYKKHFLVHQQQQDYFHFFGLDYMNQEDINL